MDAQVVRNRLTIEPTQYGEATAIITRFLETTATDTGRGTFDNKQKDVIESSALVHNKMFDLDRGLYSLLLTVPGTMDRARQLGVLKLLSNKWQINQDAFLLPQEETYLIRKLVESLPKQRQLNLFEMLHAANINNARTQKLILSTILNWDQLPWASVKYRRKIRSALTHAWGKKLTGIMKSILAKRDPELTDKDIEIAKNNMFSLTDGISQREVARECISFVLGNKGPFYLDMLRSYLDAPTNADALKLLPPEIAEEFRKRHHPHIAQAVVLEQTKDKLTVKQNLRVQSKAKELGVQVEVKAEKQDLIDLFVLAYNTTSGPYSLYPEYTFLESSIKERVKSIKLDGFPYNRVGLVIDMSKSIYGTSQNKYRPAASILAMAETLSYHAYSYPCWCGGNPKSHLLIEPEGETSLADGLLNVAMQSDLEAIFVLTDGYENAPAGRFAEVLDHLRRIGWTTPVYQVTPTFSAESFGSRKLSESVPVIPFHKIEGFPQAIQRVLFQADFVRGLANLLSSANGFLPEVRNADNRPSGARLADRLHTATR